MNIIDFIILILPVAIIFSYVAFFVCFFICAVITEKFCK